jgi:hypothetical protein
MQVMHATHAISARKSSARRAVALTAVAAALAASVLSGCAGRSREKPAISAGVREGTFAPEGAQGLDLIWFGVRDPGSEVMARVFRDGREPTFLDPACAAAWRRNGLRAVRIDEADARALDRAFERLGTVQRTQMVDSPSWGTFLSGPEWRTDISLAMPDGALRLGPGLLRLLGRTWWEPVLRPGGLSDRVRVELAPQYVAPERQSIRALSDESEDSVLDRGLVLWRLSGVLAIEPGEAIAIVPEDPAVDWGAITARDTGPRPEAPPTFPVGPQPPGPVTVGQAMLSDALLDFESQRRVVVVLMPRPRQTSAETADKPLKGRTK